MSFTILLLGLFLVTYSTRALPALLIGKVKFSSRFQLFLQLLPYTSMSALVFPAILKADSVYVSVGLIGGLAALAAAWCKLPVVLSVLLAVAADLICYQMGILF